MDYETGKHIENIWQSIERMTVEMQALKSELETINNKLKEDKIIKRV